MSIPTPVTAGTSFRSRTVGGEAVLDNAVVDDVGANVFGNVDPSPAATTVLGRLKAIADGITALGGLP